jgi:hypothetical protein
MRAVDGMSLKVNAGVLGVGCLTGAAFGLYGQKVAMPAYLAASVPAALALED